MTDSTKRTDGYEARTVKSSLRMVAWIFAWNASMVLADKAELYGWYSASWMPAAGIIFNAALGLGTIFAFIRFLGGLDELQRKIQFDALALAFGVSLVGSYTYSLMVTSGFVHDAEVSDLIVVMMVTYSLVILFGQVKYR